MPAEVKYRSFVAYEARCTFCRAQPDCDGGEWAKEPDDAIRAAVLDGGFKELGDELLCENCWTARDPTLADDDDPVGWSLVHRAHGAQRPLLVAIIDGRGFEGQIIEISNREFVIVHEGLPRRIDWALVKNVEVAVDA